MHGGGWQVVEPKVKAYLYTWGAGRTTAEGEFIPVRIEDLDIGYIDTMLILPLIIEHTIDERSPLCGHTHDSLMAVAAEIVVTFEGTTEFGNPFMARQSYLPSEIHWGHEFKKIVLPPKPNDTRYIVDVSQFHEVEAHAAIKADTPSKTSRLVVANALRTVPFPLLGENTLVLSDTMCLAPDENGHLSVMFRVGDTYGGNQFVDVSVRAYIYRWRPKLKGTCGIPDDFEVKLLETGYSTGEDHLFLWLPVVCKHVIDDESPLRSWRTPGGFERDHSSAIAVVVEGWMYSNSQERMRLRIYNVKNNVRPAHGFAAMVTPPHETPELKPRIDWSKFHHLRPLSAAAQKKDEQELARQVVADDGLTTGYGGMDDHPLVVPMGASGMMGEAMSTPGSGRGRPSAAPTAFQDTSDRDESTHTWDSARASNRAQEAMGPLHATQQDASCTHTSHGDVPAPSDSSRHAPLPSVHPSPFIDGHQQVESAHGPPIYTGQSLHPDADAARPLHAAYADQSSERESNGHAQARAWGSGSAPLDPARHSENGPGLGKGSQASMLSPTIQEGFMYPQEGYGHPPLDADEIHGTAVGSYSSTPEANALAMMPHEDPTSTFRKRTRGRPRVTFQETKDMWGSQEVQPDSGRRSGSFSPSMQQQEQEPSTGQETQRISRAQTRLHRLFSTSSNQNPDNLPV
ncbi:hypothetical protein WJX84_010244 [Apatococcus fuscideae]|uniref:Inward rectifier potassium channel C-terminal domain-containing protein n=1 Tax=Apatococcus fuscideae TaxID=2026836 RepID=A0AAW1RUK1_9CHLO